MDSALTASSSSTVTMTANLSMPSSPYSAPSTSALPSPPSSPSSLSSFPSGSSSFIFSGISSPHRPAGPPSCGAGEPSDAVAQNLVIPSLVLPPVLPQPTTYGETLGSLNILVVGRKGVGKSVLVSLLAEGNEEVVEVGSWEEEASGVGMTIRASTLWNHPGPPPEDRMEGARNVRVTELDGFDEGDETGDTLESILTAVHEPFHQVLPLLDSSQPPTSNLRELLASSNTPLCTCLIFILSSPPTATELSLLTSIGPHIPVIALPPHSKYTRNTQLSTFRPPNSLQLRQGLFRSPRVREVLRREASERFLRWREIEGALHTLRTPDHSSYLHPPGASNSVWNKDNIWTVNWEADISRDVAVQKQQVSHRHDPTSTSAASSSPVREDKWTADEKPKTDRCLPPIISPSYSDPLHLPSLAALTLSLLKTPFGRQSGVSFPQWSLGFGLAVVGAFCAGLSLGFALAGRA